MGSRGPKPTHRISTAWSRELAYSVGLITTDGCLSIDGRHVDFTSKDRSLVLAFRKCLELENQIGKKMSGFTGRKEYYRIQFGDINFYQWLLGIGLTPHKSKTLKAIKVPDHFFWDFLRGCFDGDGSMYAYWDARWRSSYMFYLQFSSASPAYLGWLQSTIQRLSGWRGRIQAAQRCNQLVFAKRATRDIFQKMYYTVTVPNLKRKRVKAEMILRADSAHSYAQVAKLGKRTSLRG